MINREAVIKHIAGWLRDYAVRTNNSGYVVGISGGIDSAVTSTLCALADTNVIAINMPIRQTKAEYERAKSHIEWLCGRFPKARGVETDLTGIFAKMEADLPKEVQEPLVMANSRARLRMTTLYAFAGRYRMLVAGTGNKVEDFGIGFFTKYGDGGVDVSPIADLYKTEVYAIAGELGVIESIRAAKPTDGLFADSRSDEEQIGASYPELEWAMEYELRGDDHPLSARQKHVLEIYRARHRANLHKMQPVPVCHIPPALLGRGDTFNLKAR